MRFETLIRFLTILNLTPGIIIFDILLPRAFRKYTTPMVFHEFLFKPNQPQNLRVETLIRFLTILKLTPGITIFDVLVRRAFWKYITPRIRFKFLNRIHLYSYLVLFLNQIYLYAYSVYIPNGIVFAFSGKLKINIHF